MMGAPPSPWRAARGARTWCLAGLAAMATGCVATEHVEPRDPFEVLSTADVPDGPPSRPWTSSRRAQGR